MDAVAAGQWANGALALGAAALAIAVGRARPRQATSLTLSVYLSLVATNAVSSLFIFGPYDGWVLLNGQVWTLTTFTLMGGAYLVFAGRALTSPLTRPFGTRIGTSLVALLFIGLASRYYFEAASTGAISSEYYGLVFDLEIGVFAAGFLAAIDGLRRARPRTAARGQAAAYLLAFGVQDLGLIGQLLLLPLVSDSWREILFFAGTIAQLVSLALLTRALFQFQLFDLDLKIKIGVKRGTIATVFVAVFLVASQLVQNITNASFGIVGGAIATGLALLALRPLERTAQRVVDAAMPRVTDTPHYLTFKKIEVYRAAVEAALEVGSIADHERDILDRLRSKLGIAREDALSAEADARERLGAPA